MQFIGVKLVLKVAGVHHMTSRFQTSSGKAGMPPPPPPTHTHTPYNTRTFGA